jgi:hypothetical protein
MHRAALGTLQHAGTVDDDIDTFEMPQPVLRLEQRCEIQRAPLDVRERGRLAPPRDGAYFDALRVEACEHGAADEAARAEQEHSARRRLEHTFGSEIRPSSVPAQWARHRRTEPRHWHIVCIAAPQWQRTH